MRVIPALAVALLLPAVAGAQVDYSALKAQSVEAHRSAQNRARNEYRHPVQTLGWFGIAPDMSVLEVWPGGGWYAEILAPYLRDNGKYYAAGFVVDAPNTPAYRKRIQKQFEARLQAAPQLYDKAISEPLGPPDSWSPAPAASLDAVLTFRNVHNWIAGGFEQKMFNSFFKMLKPGGTLGVVEHRAEPGADINTMKKTGYVTEAYVKTLAEKAGFMFVAQSDINANAMDTHDHPKGVWTLPPSLGLGDKNRAKYLAIGESDRMTLKFTKPGH